MNPITWKRGLDLRDESGVYKYAGRAYPSVTTVLAPHDDFLWVHTSAIKKEVERLIELSQNGEAAEVWVEDNGEWKKESRSPIDLLYDGEYISKAGFRLLKRSADRGSTIHDLLEDLAARACPDEDDVAGRLEEHIYGHHRSCTVDECLPYAKSLLRWFAEHSPEIILSEGSVFNDDHEYAGRLDAIMFYQGKLWCVDLKTSANFRRGWMAQLAAYSKCEFTVLEEDGIRIEWPIQEALPCAILQVQEDRAIWREVDNVEQRFNGFFLPALAAYKANKAKTGQKLPPKGVTLKQEVAA